MNNKIKTLDNYTIILDDLDLADDLLKKEKIHHSNITMVMYIVLSRINELFPDEISNIIVLEYEKIVNNIILNQAEMSDNYIKNECFNFFSIIKYSFVNNNYKIIDDTEQYYIFYDNQSKADYLILSFLNLKKILFQIINKEKHFFATLKDSYLN